MHHFAKVIAARVKWLMRKEIENKWMVLLNPLKLLLHNLLQQIIYTITNCAAPYVKVFVFERHICCYSHSRGRYTP